MVYFFNVFQHATDSKTKNEYKERFFETFHYVTTSDTVFSTIYMRFLFEVRLVW